MEAGKVGMVMKWLNKGVDLAYSLVLIVIALGTFALAIQLCYDIILDLFLQEPHGLAYTVSELMYPLIVIELFRQVVRQVRNEPFSLKPYLAIGIIASVRALLVLQMRLGKEDFDWQTGSLTLVAFATVILLLVAAYYLCQKKDFT